MQVIDWQRIVDEHAPAVWRNACRLLCNHTDASDCFSETFIFALETSRHRYIRNFSALLTHLVTVRAINRLRQKYLLSQYREQPEDLVFVPSDISEAADQIQPQDLAGILRKTLSRLWPQEAEAFCLRYLNDMSSYQIGKEFGIKSGTVETLLQRARSKLQNILELSPEDKNGKNTLAKLADALRKEVVPAKPHQDAIDAALTKLAQLTGDDLITTNRPVTFADKFAAVSNLVKITVAAAIVAALITTVIVLTRPADKQPEDTSKQLALPKTDEAVKKTTKVGLTHQVKPEKTQDVAAKTVDVTGQPYKTTAKDNVSDNTAKIKPAIQGETVTAAGSLEDRPGYIQGWLVDANGNSIKGEVQLGDLKVTSNDDGAFTIRRPTYTQFGSVLGYAFSSDRSLGAFFIWDKGYDVNDTEITVKPLATVSGFVTDSNNFAVEFNLEISVSVKDNLLYQGGIDQELWKSSIFSDSSFEINSVPTGVRLQLTVKKPGFKTLINLDNLAAGKNLDLGQIILKPLEEFDEKIRWNCSLSGFVVNEHNEPLIMVPVAFQVGPDSYKIKTDSNGRYEFKGLPQGTKIKISISTEEYGSNSFEFTCSESNSETDIQVFPPAYDWYGKTSPGLFVSKWLNTRPILLEALRGHVVLLCIGNFLDRTGPIEEIKNLYEWYQNRPLVIIAIQSLSDNLPITLNIEEKVQQYIKENNINFPFGIDDQMSVVKNIMLPEDRPAGSHLIRVPRQGLRREGAMYSLYEVKTKPAYYLIDKNGLLRASPASKMLQVWIEYLLRE